MPTIASSGWSHPEVVRYYSQARSNLQDLYPSERPLLEGVVPQATSVLDFGCATGGFLNIFRALHPGIRYLGIDRSTEMIEQARRLHPEGRFKAIKGSAPAVPNNAFDLVFSTGVLNHNPNYPALISKLYGICSTFCVLDLPRLTTHSYTFQLSSSHMAMDKPFALKKGNRPDPASVVPYVLANPGPLFKFLLTKLSPRPRALAAIGYYGKPNPGVTVPSRRVCFCVVCLFKNIPSRKGNPTLYLDLPSDVLDQIHAQGISIPRPSQRSFHEWMEAVVK